MSCLQATAQRTDIPLASFDGIPLPDKSTLKPYLKEEEEEEEDETEAEVDDFGDFSAATPPPTATLMGQSHQQQAGWGAFDGFGASGPHMQQEQSNLPPNLGSNLSVQQQPQAMPSMNFMPQQQQISNMGVTTQPFEMQQQQPSSMQQFSMGLAPPVSQPTSDWGAFGTPAMSHPPQPSATVTNTVNDEFGGFASATTPTPIQDDPFGTAAHLVTPAEPSGWDALDALAASTPVVPPPTLPDASKMPTIDQPSTEVDDEKAVPSSSVAPQIQPSVSDNHDDFGDFASSNSVSQPHQEIDSLQTAAQTSGWDALDSLAATTPAQGPPTLPNQQSTDHTPVEAKEDDFGAFSSFSSEIPVAQPQQRQSPDSSSAGKANVTSAFSVEESQTVPSASGSFEGFSQPSQPEPIQEPSRWDALDALADPTPPPPTLPDPTSAPPVGDGTVAAPVTAANDEDFGDFATAGSEQQQVTSPGWDALDALAGSTEMPPPTLAALPDPSNAFAGQTLVENSKEDKIDGTPVTSNRLDMQTSNLQTGELSSFPVNGGNTMAQEAPADVFQGTGATTEVGGDNFGDFASADKAEVNFGNAISHLSGFDAFDTTVPSSPVFERVTAVDEDFGDFESTSGAAQNPDSSDSQQLFPVQNGNENDDSALPMTDLSNGVPRMPEKKSMSSLRSDSAFYSARASSVQSDVSSLDDFVDAVQSDADQPAPKLSEINKNFYDSEKSAGEPVGMSDDDPFSAFETLAPSQHEIPPLSSLSNVDSAEPLPLPVESKDDGQKAIDEKNNHDEIDESFGDFEDVSAETGEAVQFESTLTSTQLAPSSDDFGNFAVSATKSPVAGIDSQPASGESLASEESADATFFRSSLSPQIQETTATGPEETDMFKRLASSDSDDKKGEFDAFETVGSGIISHNVSEEQGSIAKVANDMDDFGDFGTAQTADDFGAFDSMPAVSSPAGDFGAFDAVPSTSQRTDEFGTFDPTTPAPSATALDDDDFGAFDSATEKPIPVDDFGDFAGFGTTETDAAQGEEEGTSSDVMPIHNTLSDNEDDWDAFQEATHTHSSTQGDPQTKVLLEARDAILATATHVPESLMQCLGTSAGHVDFENCFEANVGVEVPVSPERQQRIERCKQIVTMLSSDRSKLAAAYWTATLSTAKDELSFAVNLCNEANKLKKNERKLAEQRFGTYLHALGEIVRVSRMIVATIGDMLMLEPSSLFTVDTFASSWCSLAILEDALAIERMWKSITDEALTFGFKKSALPAISTITELRALSSRCAGTSTADQLCQFTLQPFVQGNKTTKQVKWGERYFTACAANFLANKCAFFSCND
jgi:hypothetical protein